MKIGAIILGIIIGILWWLFNKHEDALQALGRCILNSVVGAILIYCFCSGGWWTVIAVCAVIYFLVDGKRYGNG